LHELSNLFKISICREICTNWILNSQLYLCIFFICYLTDLSVIYTCFQLFSVKRLDWLGLEPGHMRSCQLLVWQVDRPNALITHPDVILTGSYPSLCFLYHPHTNAFLLIYHVMLCICLANFSRDFGILYTSLLIPWYLMCPYLFF